MPSDVQALYRLHASEIKTYLRRRVRCAETAAELTQETFVRFMRSAARTPIESPRAYLYRIAANLLTDHSRKKSVRLEVVSEDAVDQVADSHPGAEQTVLAKEELRRLQQAVDVLPPRRQEIFILHKYEGLSYSEIAERLGISKNTVMVQMMKALSFCRDHLADDKRK